MEALQQRPRRAESALEDWFAHYLDWMLKSANGKAEGKAQGPQVGFAGVGKPWKVERALTAAGCDLKEFVPFPDHAAYSAADMRFLTDRAAVFDARLVTTEKDWVRLTPEQRKAVVAWPVVARFEDEAAFAAFLNDRI